MLHMHDWKKEVETPVKISKRKYLNLKSNENLISDENSIADLAENLLTLDNFVKYPVFDVSRNALQNYLNTDNIQITSGCHDAIRLISSNLDKRKNKVLLTIPNYTAYAHYFKLHDIVTVNAERTPEHKHSLLVLMERAIKENCNIIVLTNPDPFVGDNFAREEIILFLSECLHNGITIILDEVYAGFGRESDIDLTKKFENLLILNSFSKSFGMPGIRIGWIAGNKEIINVLSKEFPESGISNFSLAIMTKLLRKENLIVEFRNQVVETRNEIFANINLIEGITPYSNSVTNFVLFKVNKAITSNLWHLLEEKGVYIADLNLINHFENHYRITVCHSKKLEGLYNALRTI
ncbi:aminotransferase class I/II-fold pyridoxal phosphate-dependent enzyme [Xenorhabdus bovienii]|uniref:aminotransferase class I/II-fold pyridoxal phosphate-dependent enzyme n=1 Tax=Xenorhabdus bovienii TaxID=40576 RepID=UPI0023B2B2FD|nr:aminotransferase class I/II-fold pyridoxal phosphate-dependent enzyme [Xenorhabdus bovienii]MDE9541060.1 aminotransferase class I/II-fold pyridoxal phosphate-dependent enzyme [Xenorhabdus bovienii]